MNVQTGPYEILLRFNCEVGETFGQLRGVSRAMKSYVVDDKGVITGRIDSGQGDLPADFPVEEIEKLLGQRFTAFNAQLEAVTAEKEALARELETKSREYAEASSQLEMASARLSEAANEIETLTAQKADLEVKAAAVAAASQQRRR